MIVRKTLKGLRRQLDQAKKEGKTIGFTPTLGALHQGHVSLINRTVEENEISVCSIFVNPTQFNEKSDLKKYPRTFQADSKLLKEANLDILFFPSANQVYPKGLNTKVKVNLGGLDTLMEGGFRPGHFEGVVQVVKRLLDMVQPDRLYMGQKDFQQFTIIQKMINELKIKTELVVCPIVREPHGLAMSSRNERLSKETRKKAKVIFNTLSEIKANLNDKSPEEWMEWSMKKLKRKPFNPEYVSIVDGHTLLPVKSFRKHKYVVVCAAVWADDVRLIDNVILKNNSK